jgi:hypothetical protein
MAIAFVQARPVVMRERETIVVTSAQKAKEAVCVLLLLLVAAMYVFVARRGPVECSVFGSKMDGWVQPTAVFLLGGQLAIFHNLGLSALM